MEILHRNPKPLAPAVSMILLDWSCRESFHSLDYLARQTVPREQYEIVWIEIRFGVPGYALTESRTAKALVGSSRNDSRIVSFFFSSRNFIVTDSLALINRTPLPSTTVASVGIGFLFEFQSFPLFAIYVS